MIDYLNDLKFITSRLFNGQYMFKYQARLAEQLKKMYEDNYLPAFIHYSDWLDYMSDFEKSKEVLLNGTKNGSLECKYCLFLSKFDYDEYDNEFYKKIEDFAAIGEPDAIKLIGQHYIENGEIEEGIKWICKRYDVSGDEYVRGYLNTDKDIIEYFINNDVKEIFFKYATGYLRDMLTCTFDILNKKDTTFENSIIFDAYKQTYYDQLMDYLAYNRKYVPALQYYLEEIGSEKYLDEGVRLNIPDYVACNMQKDMTYENIENLKKISDNGSLVASNILAEYYWDYYDSKRFDAENAYKYGMILAQSGNQNYSNLISNIIDSLRKHNYNNEYKKIKEIYYGL